MQRHRYLLGLFCLIWLLVVLDFAAETLHLYWMFWWFDYVTHFLGGLWLGSVALWLRYRSGYLRKGQTVTESPSPYVTALLVGMLAGLMWESFEQVMRMVSAQELPINYLTDTGIDLAMDGAGALVAGLLFATRVQRLTTRKT